MERYKARLVTKGFHQQEGIDFGLTYNPIVKASTVRIVLALSVSRLWKLHHIDVCNVFLNGELHEIIFMTQPSEFINLINLIMSIVGSVVLYMALNRHLECGINEYVDSFNLNDS